jgi:hypothetical protein
VFNQVKSLLQNFRGDIVKEQNESTARCNRENKWILAQIGVAVRVLNIRTRDVNALVKHIKWLQNEIQETNNAIQHRQKRIRANLALLKKFEKERCKNNLIFVHQLRNHIEGINVLGLLREDLVAYFKSGRMPSSSFLEVFAEYENLLDDEHRNVLAQLKAELENGSKWRKLHANTQQYTKEGLRTNVGTGHVDNNRGALKADAVPSHEKFGAWRLKFRDRVLALLDQLVLHLRNSRNNLTANEIKAAEDFAIFQNNMYKENATLTNEIDRKHRRLVSLQNRLNKAKVQLQRRERLRKQAADHLRYLRRMKKQKDDYCRREDLRRQRELDNVARAQQIFQNVLNKLSVRVRLRTQSKLDGRRYGKSEDYEKRVVSAAGGAAAGLSRRQKERYELAY